MINLRSLEKSRTEKKVLYEVYAVRKTQNKS